MACWECFFCCCFLEVLPLIRGSLERTTKKILPVFFSFQQTTCFSNWCENNPSNYDALNQNVLRYHLLLHALLHTLMLMNSVRGERVPGLCLGGCDYSNGMPLWAEVLYCCLSLLVAWKMRWWLSLWGDTSNWRRITFPSQPSSCLSEKAFAVNAGSAVCLGEAASPDAGPGTGFDLLLEEAETDPHSQGRGKCDV